MGRRMGEEEEDEEERKKRLEEARALAPVAVKKFASRSGGAPPRSARLRGARARARRAAGGAGLPHGGRAAGVGAKTRRKQAQQAQRVRAPAARDCSENGQSPLWQDTRQRQRLGARTLRARARKNAAAAPPSRELGRKGDSRIESARRAPVLLNQPSGTTWCCCRVGPKS
ncbi:unnamed protein product [Prorocentrum cordatum]|uniref:Uncharacterized protein n=1 Tax=Prorocentrum cordatum TaxID=2364126 RepID=A0ABN9SY83_9DINO|nr:unnamed protein product [Polarella glacialis]